MSLSLCMIVKNEENTLSRCLESVKDIVDEIILVDTGSTDNTVEIAKGYGAKVFFYKWDNSFANARNYSLSKASKDWILIMDADDELVKEDKDKVNLLINNEENKLNAYFGETLSYSGEIKNYNIYSNLNIRFIRNGKGYKFIGDIHEQITPGSDNEKKQGFLGLVDIRFYHYGYLNETIIKKNKRKRNMDIIEKMLNNDPNNAFMLYNMGVEYSAKGDYSEALKYLNQAYKNFTPTAGFGSKLILKMISCNENLNNLDECLKLIEVGQKYYPACTEYEFCKANIFYKKRKYLSAIESAKKCISMGESPILLREVSGIATYKSYYLLGIIAFNIGDYEDAYDYLNTALKINSKLTDALFKISEILFMNNTDIKQIQNQLESYFHTIDEDTAFLLSKIFYQQNKFEVAYYYINKIDESIENTQRISFYKGIYLYYLKNYTAALENLYKVTDKEYLNTATYCAILCALFIKKYEEVDNLISIAKNFDEPEEIIVYNNFISLIKGNSNTILKCEDNYKNLLQSIFNLLEVLLKGNCLDEFNKALTFLNQINDDSIFLNLGKLYHKYGYLDLSYKEFIKSIKINENIDASSLFIMNSILKQRKS
ncbi:glycosyltransferase [Clostridium sp. AL.422]|uniref:tetratricopeptide repeat-containing glycosyltransferase family 2 protein n=1 Tax=Clostridium TaxID=1485 RepID=UPI00293DF489|nr:MULTISPECIES: glycosyltransferase [unclassified Clostridium]MDV4150902.1 glycosyltransferase [Clostridium sp. AL.422]